MVGFPGFLHGDFIRGLFIAQVWRTLAYLCTVCGHCEGKTRVRRALGVHPLRQPRRFSTSPGAHLLALPSAVPLLSVLPARSDSGCEHHAGGAELPPTGAKPNLVPSFIVGMFAAAARVGDSLPSGAVVQGRESQPRRRRGSWVPRVPCAFRLLRWARRSTTALTLAPVGEMSSWSQKEEKILCAGEKIFWTRES